MLLTVLLFLLGLTLLFQRFLRLLLLIFFLDLSLSHCSPPLSIKRLFNWYLAVLRAALKSVSFVAYAALRSVDIVPIFYENAIFFFAH